LRKILAAFACALALAAAGSGRDGREDDMAICAVCGPHEGAGFEVVKARATYRDVAYAFCSVRCKVDFLKDPESFLVTDVGTEAPPFSLPRLDGGGPATLAEFRGRVILLDFWATFCAPCVAALPKLEALATREKPAGLTVVGLLVDEKPELAVKLARKAGVGYPLLRASPEVWKAYRVNALPSLVLVGRDGKIRKRFGGESPAGSLEAEIAAALAENAE
jgi:thiol-disulfide isomerase/thioredoxin